MRAIPDPLRHRPFTRGEAADLGVTSRMLEGRRFTRVFPQVWRTSDYAMTPLDWIDAACLAVGDRAHLTGISRLQRLGLPHGPLWPVRFVVESDLHLDIEAIFVHRTKRLAPLDGGGVIAAGAFIAYCARARVIDAITVGDWLLHHHHTSIDQIRTLALSALWRTGAHECVWVLEHLDPAARSLKESETRSVLAFAGLPRPDVNRVIASSTDVRLVGDLVYREWRTVVEFEGRQHREDPQQYEDDIDRYAVLRSEGIGYVQVTHAKLGRPRSLAGEVYRELTKRGYTGPPPAFEQRWSLLFTSLSSVVGPRHEWLAARARGAVS